MEKYFVMSLIIFLASCGGDDEVIFQDSLFDVNRQIGIVKSDLLTEVSGIAHSRSMDGVIWAHNDSGDGARVYMLDESGNHLGIVNLEGIAARDWEDMAIGPGPMSDHDYIYIADTGDNNEISKVLYIYRFLEPSFEISNTPMEYKIKDVDRIEVIYNDKPRDTETILIDPLTKDILLVTKNSENSEVYRLPFPQSLNKRNALQLINKLPFGRAVGGDISADGQEILIKNYDSIYYWQKSANESLTRMFSRMPSTLPYIREPQGEAIAWHRDNLGFYTISEQIGSKSSPIYFYSRK